MGGLGREVTMFRGEKEGRQGRYGGLGGKGEEFTFGVRGMGEKCLGVYKGTQGKARALGRDGRKSRRVIGLLMGKAWEKRSGSSNQL